jgi:hypothetical protein
VTGKDRIAIAHPGNFYATTPGDHTPPQTFRANAIAKATQMRRQKEKTSLNFVK